jgi:CHAD domain-containing protein
MGRRLLKKSKNNRDIDPGERLGRCLGEILEARLGLMYFFADKSLTSRDIEMLHKMRVSARRLQSFLKIFEELYPRKRFKACYGTLRRLLRESGRVRELDILIAALSDYRSSHPAPSGIVFDVLIARRIHEQQAARKVLSRSLRELNRETFRSQLMSFA